jgi:hypothetical protein
MAPVRASISSGNCDALLLLLVTLCLTWLLNGKPVRAAVALAVAISVKFPIAFLLWYLVAQRKIRALIFAIAGAASIILLSFAVVGFARLADWWEAGRYYGSSGYAASPSSLSVHAVLLRLLTDNPFVVAVADSQSLAAGAYLAIALPIAAAMVWLTMVQAGDKMFRGLLFSFVIVGELLISPVTEFGHMTLLVLPLVVLSGQAGTRWRRTNSLVCAAVVAAILLLLVYPPALVILAGAVGIWLLQSNRQALAVLLLLGIGGALLAVAFLGLPDTHIDFNRESPVPLPRALLAETNLLTIGFIWLVLAATITRYKRSSQPAGSRAELALHA